MSLEAIVTNVKVESHKNRVAVTLWKHGTIYLPYMHTFASKYMSDNQLQETLELLKTNISTSNLEFDINTGIMSSPKNERGRTNIFLYGPPCASEGFDETLEKRFITGHYTEMARENIVRPGEVITIDETLADTLMSIRQYNERLDDVRDEIARHDNKQKKGTITRRFNELDKALQYEHEETLDDKLIGRVGEEAVRKRTELEEAYRKTEESKQYTLEREESKAELTVPDAGFIKDRRGITGKEWREYPWVDLDIEIPLFKNPEEAMISWVGTIYHDKNDVRKVLYTLSDVG
ncbi:MAG: hypothetical protein ACQESE_04765, partial [Nanobdellota archaeon]